MLSTTGFIWSLYLCRIALIIKFEWIVVNVQRFKVYSSLETKFIYSSIVNMKLCISLFDYLITIDIITL